MVVKIMVYPSLRCHHADHHTSLGSGGQSCIMLLCEQFMSVKIGKDL